MTTQQDMERSHRKRQGQTLAEFAITLPILLILMFGIIEFGRIFQAWVSLQNAARTAARYASTGQYDEVKYKMNLELNNNTPKDDVDTLVPCVNDANGDDTDAAYNYSPGIDQRGTLTTYKGVTVYQGGMESLFASWNNGANCDPFDAKDQEKRRDMGRILSIIDKAREGAAGLAIEGSFLTVPADKKSPANQPWYAVWDNPQPRSDQRSWFNVMICSTRKMVDDKTSKAFYDKETGRFVTYLGEKPLRDSGGQDHSTTGPNSLYAPGCYLNEKQVAGTDSINAGKPWSDPGGPADTVIIVISFNHPLITPLGLTNFIPMQARRTAIVEAFRAVDPRNALGPPNSQGSGFPTDTPEPTDTPLPTDTATATASATLRVTNTPAPPTQGPFDCSRLSADGLTIAGGNVFISLHNQNLQATYITRVIFRWQSIFGNDGMSLFEMALDQYPHWKGPDNADPYPAQNTTDTNTSTFFATVKEVDRTIAGNSTGDWSATFSNGPTNMELVTTINDYAATFYLFNPVTKTDCVIPLITPTPTPVPTIDPKRPTNTATYTPDCASSLLSINFIGFEAFGLVHLEVRSNRRVVSPLTDFSINWVQRAPGILTLDRVTTVAPYGQPKSFEVWNSGPDTQNPAQDAQPPTKGHNDPNATQGVWLGNYNFPAAPPSGGPSITGLYLDFGGVTGLLSDIGVTPSDFNGTQFNIGCGSNTSGPNGPSGTGTNPGGTIVLSEIPTPTPTGTKGPTKTPAPTLTPSNTRPSPTPSKTPTPGPTATKPPATSTPLPTKTPTPKPLPTQPGTTCQDNCT